MRGWEWQEMQRVKLQGKTFDIVANDYEEQHSQILYWDEAAKSVSHVTVKVGKKKSIAKSALVYEDAMIQTVYTYYAFILI